MFAPLPLLHHHCTAIIFDFQNVITVFSYKFLFFNAIWMFLNFEYLLLANTILHLKHYCFSTIWIGVFFHYVEEFVFFFQKSSSAYINKPTHADTVIKSCSAKWVFSQNPKIYTKNISLSKLIFNWNTVLQHATWLSQGKQNS